MEFFFYFLIIVLFIAVFANFANLKQQITALQSQLTQLQQQLLSFTQQLYQSDKTHIEKENDTTQEESVLNTPFIPQNETNFIEIEQEMVQSTVNMHSDEIEENSSESVTAELEIIQPLKPSHQQETFSNLALNEQNEPVLPDTTGQSDFESIVESPLSVEHDEAKVETLTIIEQAFSAQNTEPDNQPEIKQASSDPFESYHKHTRSNGTNIGYSLFNWLIKVNIITKIAIIILFLGLTYLFKYGIEHQRHYLSPEVRILGALILGIGLLAIGWKLRYKRRIYALILQGGAIAILYLTIFATFKLYELIPALITFAILVVICSSSILFSILQRAISLAIIACVGGYVTPILLSDGSGNHVALFSYYLMISTAILIISITQSWRILNLIGFTFTFVVSLVWGIQSFTPEFYKECQIFILGNLVIYGVLAVLLSIRSIHNKEKYQNIIDLLLLFGAPLCGFGLQYAITQQWEFGPAFSSLGFGLFYLGGAFIIFHLWKSLAKTLSLYWLAIGVSFITLSIPLALSANWTATLWMFEGTAITWIMLSQKYYRTALSGTLIMSLGIISAAISLENNQLTPTLYTSLLGISSIILLVNACLWHQYGQKTEVTKLIKSFCLSIAVVVWILWILLSIPLFLQQIILQIPLILLCFTVSFWLWYFIGKKINWNIICHGMVLLWAVLAISLLKSHAVSYYYFSSYWPCNLAWIAAFISGYIYLYKIQDSKINSNTSINNKLILLHISLFWLLLIWLAREIFHVFDILSWGYEVIKWSLLATIASGITLLLYILIKRRYITSLSLIKSYWSIGLLPLISYMAFYLIVGLGMSGQIIYWPYIPIVNPLEESAIFSLIMLCVWLKLTINYLQIENKTTNFANFKVPLPNLILILLVVLTFLWANSIVLRCLSQTFDITWSTFTLWHNNIVQMTASLLWMLSAVILIAIGHRYSLRKIWFCGQLIQIIVIIKLIFVDIREIDGLLRAFAFIGVALLMLLIGYLAPLPPKQNNESVVENE